MQPLRLRSPRLRLCPTSRRQPGHQGSRLTSRIRSAASIWREQSPADPPRISGSRALKSANDSSVFPAPATRAETFSPTTCAKISVSALWDEKLSVTPARCETTRSSIFVLGSFISYLQNNLSVPLSNCQPANHHTFLKNRLTPFLLASQATRNACGWPAVKVSVMSFPSMSMSHQGATLVPGMGPLFHPPENQATPSGWGDGILSRPTPLPTVLVGLNENIAIGSAHRAGVPLTAAKPADVEFVVERNPLYQT